ncbi:MAG TPA: hypothetical protein VNH18_01265, partial [Bryobacteraceae bacterium]|nr:hypothetical protein [Bryobacteraceae bacterium]
MRLLSNSLVLVVGLLALSTAVQAKNKKIKTPPKEPQDEIEVVGHILLTNGPVRRFLTTQHYSSYYLYVEYAASKSVTLIDVTKAAQPFVLADVSYPSNGGSASLFTVAGTAALVTEERGEEAPASAPQTIRIMDFSDPLHPKVAREFAGVTSISRDERRGLIYVANAEGVWILHQSFAEDPEV